MASLASRADPRRAARFYTGSLTRSPSSSDEIPALLWLWAGVVVLARLRSGDPTNFSGSEIAVYGGVAGVIVLLGRLMPRAVLLILVALLVAGALGAAPVVASALATAQGYVSGAFDKSGGSRLGGR